MECVVEKVGPWHIPVFLLSLTGSIPYGLFVMSLSFMAPKMNYWCKPPEGINDTHWIELNEGVDLQCEVRSTLLTNHSGSASALSNVTQTHRCDEWEYDHSVHTRTLIEEVSRSLHRKHFYLPFHLHPMVQLL